MPSITPEGALPFLFKNLYSIEYSSDYPLGNHRKVYVDLRVVVKTPEGYTVQKLTIQEGFLKKEYATHSKLFDGAPFIPILCLLKIKIDKEERLLA